MSLGLEIDRFVHYPEFEGMVNLEIIQGLNYLESRDLEIDCLEIIYSGLLFTRGLGIHALAFIRWRSSGIWALARLRNYPRCREYSLFRVYMK